MKRINNNEKFLIITATHGDEAFSIPVVAKLENLYPQRFNNIVGNPLALQQGKRFVNLDLNRVAPGAEKSKIYEVKRANYLINKSKDFLFLLDIHGSDANCGIFTIITNPTPANVLLAYALPITRIVIWGSKNNGRAIGPLSRFVNCGVGIECGPKKSNLISKVLLKTLKNFLSAKFPNFKRANEKELYQVFGKIKDGEINKSQKKKLKDFKEIKINGQKFFPLLVNQYKDEKIVCYKMEKVNFYGKFSFSY